MGVYKGLSSPTADFVIEIISRFTDLEKENQCLREDLEQQREEIKRLNLKEETVNETYQLAYKQLQEAYFAECRKNGSVMPSLSMLCNQPTPHETLIRQLEQANETNAKLEKQLKEEIETSEQYKALFKQANAAKRHYRRTEINELNSNFSAEIEKEERCNGHHSTYEKKGHFYCMSCDKKMS